MRRVLSKLDDLLLVVVIAGGSWWGYGQLRGAGDGAARAPVIGTQAEAQPPRPALPSAPSAAAVLETLEVKGRAPKTGYDRKAFGRGWVDVDRNGCDTRNDMLRRDLTDVVVDPKTNGCVALSGTLLDPYSGGTVVWVKGNKTSTAAQVDHVVALSDAWQKGAQEWSEDERVRFANDPRNLLVVSDTMNRQKKDGDAATWLPPRPEYRCEYVGLQVAVKAAYRLSVTEAERTAIGRVLAGCRG